MKFLSALDRIRCWQRLGRLAIALILTLAVFAVLTLTIGLADAWVGFEPGARLAWVATAWVILALAAIWSLSKAVRISRERASVVADGLCDSSRKIGSAALSLKGDEHDSDLGKYLSERLLNDAADELSKVPIKRLIPWRRIVRASCLAAICLLPLLILSLVAPRAFHTITERLYNPSTGLPPWSHLVFTVDPEKPSCIYGGELTVSVTVDGADQELEHPVECLVRHTQTGEIGRLPAFRESASEYSRTLEGVTEPIELAFACGRARSGWHPVTLLLQPKVLAGKVTVTPPAYTGLGPVEMPLDRNEVAALEGAEIALQLTSNRPLADSSLMFTPLTTQGQEVTQQEILGRADDVHSITFRWTVTGSGQIAASLKDVQGTPAASAFELSLRAVPDQAPLVNLVSPPRMLFATPKATIALRGTAEDDYALSRVQLIRNLTGFRDRSEVVAAELQSQELEVVDQLDLDGLGVTPGQMIEVFIEASDHNPSLLGQGASEISRIQIISEEEYAARIRAQTTLKEFNLRFKLIQEERRKAIEALEEMKKAIDGGDLNKLEEARKAAEKAHREAAELLGKLADEFPAFEAEKRLQELAREQAGKLAENERALGEFAPKGDAQAKKDAVQKMLDRLGGRPPQLEKIERDAELMAQAGALLEMAAKFRQIHANQKSVAKRIHTLTKELAMGKDANRRLLPLLAETQRKNRRALDKFEKNLKKRADAAEHPDLLELKEAALDFHKRLLQSDPGSVMDLAAESGDKGKSHDALVNAQLALKMLEGLMDQPDPFSQACQNKGMQFKVPIPDINKTLEQLLEAMMGQNPGENPGDKPGEGGGMGFGMGPNGNAQRGNFNMNIPVVGPERMSFDSSQLGGEAKGHGGKSGKIGPNQVAENGKINPAERQHTGNAGPNLKNVPEAYREAIKTYFLPE